MPERARRSARRLGRFSIERRRALKWLLVPAAGFAISQAYAAPSVASTRVWPAQEYTRVILEGPDPIPHQLTALRDPDRLVLDLEGVELTSQFAKLATQISPSDPYIVNVRFGRPVYSVLRVVFDLRAAVNPQVFQLAPIAEFAHRLVLDLYPVNPVDPLMALLDRDPALSLPPPIQRGPRAVPRLAPSRRIVVAIDPGHGGEDPGAIGPRGTYEKHVVLAISRRLKRLIDHDTNLRAVLTRDDDYFVPLAQRVAKARRVQADLFVSIHADAFREARARGSSVFALSETGATSAAARWLAQKEND